MKQVFISGCGDIGVRVARECQAKGWQVTALSRTEMSDRRLSSFAIEPVRGDLDDPASLGEVLFGGMVLFHFAPPPNSGESDPRLRNLLTAIDKSGLPERIILISTTAVYGDSGGEWVTETSPVAPQTARGKRRLDAEQVLQRWSEQHQVPVVILRVPGIYGPDRLPVERIKSGQPILREQDAPFTNRIHADDLAMVCVAAAERAPAGAIYNVSDGQPGNMSQYFRDVANALGLPCPPEVSREEAEQVLSAGMLSYLNESRRVSNQKMRDELGVQLRYPNLTAGLTALTDSLMES